MTALPARLLDTSIFIARQAARRLAELPSHGAVSVATIGELRLGVFNAPDGETRARRADALALARSIEPIPISEAVMVSWARIVSDCTSLGVRRVVKLMDTLIAATAVEHGLAVVTQDDDFDDIARAHRELRVVKV